MPDDRVHAAIVRLSAADLALALHLPEGWKIRAIRPAADAYDDALLVVVEGDDLPSTLRGEPLITLHGTYVRQQDGVRP